MYLMFNKLKLHLLSCSPSSKILYKKIKYPVKENKTYGQYNLN